MNLNDMVAFFNSLWKEKHNKMDGSIKALAIAAMLCAPCLAQTQKGTGFSYFPIHSTRDKETFEGLQFSFLRSPAVTATIKVVAMVDGAERTASCTFYTTDGVHAGECRIPVGSLDTFKVKHFDITMRVRQDDREVDLTWPFDNPEPGNYYELKR